MKQQKRWRPLVAPPAAAKDLLALQILLLALAKDCMFLKDSLLLVLCRGLLTSYKLFLLRTRRPWKVLQRTWWPPSGSEMKKPRMPSKPSLTTSMNV
jgi:hypothetical protein